LCKTPAYLRALEWDILPAVYSIYFEEIFPRKYFFKVYGVKRLLMSRLYSADGERSRS